MRPVEVVARDIRSTDAVGGVVSVRSVITAAA
jgi:hypothetical protein